MHAARYGSGVALLIQARKALEQGAESFTIPGRNVTYKQPDLPALRQKIMYSM